MSLDDGPAPRRIPWTAQAWSLTTYVLLTLALSWPLPRHLSTHVTGALDQDASVYLWNLWAFRHELAGGRSPLATSMLFAPTPDRVDLSLHNYTLFADLLGLGLQGPLGLVRAFNLIYLACLVLGAQAMFLLGLEVTAGARLASWLAGALFAFSPFLTARGTGHFSLAAAAPLPLFLWLLLRAARSGRRREAVGAGLALAWAALCDPYYAVFCVLIAGFHLAWHSFELRWAGASGSQAERIAVWTLDGIAGAAGGLVLAHAAAGGAVVELMGRRIGLETIYTPVLVGCLALLARGWVLHRPRPRPAPGVAARTAVRQVLWGAAAAAVVLSPLLAAVGRRVLDGRYVQPEVRWRSSPPGVDALAFLLPNPWHPLWGRPVRAWLEARPNGAVENTASLGWTALAVIALAARRRRGALPPYWTRFTLGFALLALGPFVVVGGVPTCIPTPWALLRYLPVVANARVPARLAVIVVLGTAVLFAISLAALRRDSRAPGRLAALVAAALLFELSPAPRPLFSAEPPAVFEALRDGGRAGAVLPLPVGVRSGTSSTGRFDSAHLYYQTLHGRPLVGGYLSRVEPERAAAYRALPVLDALLTLSEGRTPSGAQLAGARADAPRFLRESGLGYVVIDTRQASPALQRFARDALRLRLVAASEPYQLLAP